MRKSVLNYNSLKKILFLRRIMKKQITYHYVLMNKINPKQLMLSINAKQFKQKIQKNMKID